MVRNYKGEKDDFLHLYKAQNILELHLFIW